MRTHALVVLLGFAVACGDDSESSTGSGGSGGGSGGAGGSGATVDDAAVSADAAAYTDLSRVNDTPFMSSQHEGMPMVNVYCNSTAAATYEALAAGSTFPAGSLIVKEMLDAEGEPAMLTAMYKGPEGYDPDNRDWWWGMLTLEGEPAMSGSVGKVAMCNGCHQAQAMTDAAFGLPE